MTAAVDLEKLVSDIAVLVGAEWAYTELLPGSCLEATWQQSDPTHVQVVSLNGHIGGRR